MLVVMSMIYTYVPVCMLMHIDMQKRSRRGKEKLILIKFVLLVFPATSVLTGREF